MIASFCHCPCLPGRLCLWPCKVRRQCPSHYGPSMASPYFHAVGLRPYSHGALKKPKQSTQVPAGTYL